MDRPIVHPEPRCCVTIELVTSRSRWRRTLTTALAGGLLLAASCSAPDAPSARPRLSTDEAAAPGTAAPSASQPPSSAAPLDTALEHPAVLDELRIPRLTDASWGRVFATSFEDPADLAGFYVTPQSTRTHHEVSGEQVHSGTHAHKGWVTGAGAIGVEVDGPNHRGYPTIPLDRVGPGGQGGFSSPSVVQLWVWLDVALTRKQWFSFATLTNDASTKWSRVVTVNLDPDGYVDLFHVPGPDQHETALQRTDVAFPLRTWVRLTVFIDLRPATGSVAVWQGATLIAAARVDPGGRAGTSSSSPSGDRLEQVHFGLYAPPEVAAATIYNDDITVAELRRPGVGP